jgi:alkyl hydroperoxide reductase subunit F
MLDNNIIEQLKTVFQKLENNVELVYSKSNHADQKQLVEMLNDISLTSNKIVLRENNLSTDAPSFHIFRYSEWS